MLCDNGIKLNVLRFLHSKGSLKTLNTVTSTLFEYILLYVFDHSCWITFRLLYISHV